MHQALKYHPCNSYGNYLLFKVNFAPLYTIKGTLPVTLAPALSKLGTPISCKKTPSISLRKEGRQVFLQQAYILVFHVNKYSEKKITDSQWVDMNSEICSKPKLFQVMVFLPECEARPFWITLVKNYHNSEVKLGNFFM